MFLNGNLLSAIIGRCQELTAKVKAENRDFTTDEAEKLNSLLNEFDLMSGQTQKWRRQDNRKNRKMAKLIPVILKG